MSAFHADDRGSNPLSSILFWVDTLSECHCPFEYIICASRVSSDIYVLPFSSRIQEIMNSRMTIFAEHN